MHLPVSMAALETTTTTNTTNMAALPPTRTNTEAVQALVPVPDITPHHPHHQQDIIQVAMEVHRGHIHRSRVGNELCSIVCSALS